MWKPKNDRDQSLPCGLIIARSALTECVPHLKEAEKNLLPFCDYQHIADTLDLVIALRKITQHAIKSIKD